MKSLTEIESVEMHLVFWLMELWGGLEINWVNLFKGTGKNRPSDSLEKNQMKLIFWGKEANLPMPKIHQQNAGILNLDNQDTLLLGKHTRV